MKSTIRVINKNKYIILLLFIILVYIIVFSYLSILRYLSFNSHYYDLGIMHQVVYNTSIGRILEMTNPDFNINLSRLAIHFDPILALLAPFYWLYSGAETLLVIQTIIIALGAVPIYLPAQKILKKKFLSLAFALLYLSYYPLHNANLFDFHAAMFLPAFLLFAFYFMEIGKLKLSFLFIVLSLLCKENVGLTIFFLGLYLIFIRKKFKYGLFLSSFSLTIFFLVVFFIIPYFRQGEHFALKYYSNNFFENLFSLTSVNYLFKLLLPVVFLPIFAPFILFIATPELLINLISNNPNMRLFYFHYTSLIIPFIFIASIYGFKFLLQKKPRLAWLILLPLLLNIYLIYQNSTAMFIKKYKIDQNKLAVVKRWQREFADDQIRLSATPRLAPFFSGRTYFYNFLYDPAFWDMGIKVDDIIKNIGKYEKADYVIIAKSEVNQPQSLENKFYNHLKANPKFQLYFEGQEIEVYKKSEQ